MPLNTVNTGACWSRILKGAILLQLKPDKLLEIMGRNVAWVCSVNEHHNRANEARASQGGRV